MEIWVHGIMEHGCMETRVNGNMGVWKNWFNEIWVNGKMRMETWPNENENGQMETWVNEPHWNGNTKTSELSMGMEIRRNGDMGIGTPKNWNETHSPHSEPTH